MGITITSPRRTETSTCTRVSYANVPVPWQGYKVEFECVAHVETATDGDTLHKQYYARRTDLESLRWYHYIAIVIRDCFGLPGGSRWRVADKDLPAMRDAIDKARPVADIDTLRIDTLPQEMFSNIVRMLIRLSDVRGLVRLAQGNTLLCDKVRPEADRLNVKEAHMAMAAERKSILTAVTNKLNYIEFLRGSCRLHIFEKPDQVRLLRHMLQMWETVLPSILSL